MSKRWFIGIRASHSARAAWLASPVFGAPQKGWRDLSQLRGKKDEGEDTAEITILEGGQERSSKTRRGTSRGQSSRDARQSNGSVNE